MSLLHHIAPPPEGPCYGEAWGHKQWVEEFEGGVGEVEVEVAASSEGWAREEQGN